MIESVVFTIGSAHTTGTNEEVIPLIENGDAPKTDIAVPAGSQLVITDFDAATGGALASFKIQQTNDKNNYFTIAQLHMTGMAMGSWVTASPNTAWVIDGNAGPEVSIRLAVTTPNGAIPVACVMSGYRRTPD